MKAKIIISSLLLLFANNIFANNNLSVSDKWVLLDKNNKEFNFFNTNHKNIILNIKEKYALINNIVYTLEINDKEIVISNDKEKERLNIIKKIDTALTNSYFFEVKTNKNILIITPTN